MGRGLDGAPRRELRSNEDLRIRARGHPQSAIRPMIESPQRTRRPRRQQVQVDSKIALGAQMRTETSITFLSPQTVLKPES